MKRIVFVLMSLFAATVFAQPPAVTPKKATYIICSSDGVTIYPSKRYVSFLELQGPGNGFENLLDQVEKEKDSQYLVVLARPQSVKIFRLVRTMIGRRPIDVANEPVDANFKFGPDELPMPNPNSSKFVTDKEPVFFECRNNEVFYINKPDFDEQVTSFLTSLSPNVRSGKLDDFLKAINEHKITNEYYKVNASYLLSAIMALEPLPGVHGETSKEIEKPESKFQKALESVYSKRQYVVFLIRDDSFAAFRRARSLAAEKHLGSRWELLEAKEPIKFGTSTLTVVGD